MTRGSGLRITPEEAAGLAERGHSRGSSPAGKVKAAAPPNDAARSGSTAGQARHAALKRAALAALKAEGCWAWSQPVGALKVGDRFVRFGVAGQGDIVGSVPIPCPEAERFTLLHDEHCHLCGGTEHIPRALVVEVKTGAGKLSPDQQSFLAEARRRGWLVIVCRDTVDELVATVRWAMGRAR